MRRRPPVAAGLLLALALSGSSASVAATRAVMVSTVTSYGLAEQCKASPGDRAMDFCTGYILGVFDQLTFDGTICASGEAITGRALAVARKYIADHPERWDRHPSELVGETLKTAFPCPAAPRR